MTIFIKINEAIAEYNRTMDAIKNGKMTQASLAEIVFKDEAIAEQSKLVYLSQWQNGKMIERCRILYFVRISQATGVPLSDLIKVIQ